MGLGNAQGLWPEGLSQGYTRFRGHLSLSGDILGWWPLAQDCGEASFPAPDVHSTELGTAWLKRPKERPREARRKPEAWAKVVGLRAEVFTVTGNLGPSFFQRVLGDGEHRVRPGFREAQEPRTYGQSGWDQ